MKMFFKKYWYKFTDRKKYQDYKFSQIIKKETENFKNNLEKYINGIQQKIKTKNQLSFLHSGTSGDVINSLPVIKELSKTHKCNFYLQINKPHKVIHRNNYSNVVMNENTLNMLLPLLKCQKYINNVEKYNNQEIDINFDNFRELPISFLSDNLRYCFHLVGIQPDILEAYISVDPHKKITNKVVILRTLRYQNYFISYKFLENYENLFFIGTKVEYEDLKKEVKNLQFYSCRDFLEVAMIIKSCRVFIGNSSIGHGLAEALKIPRLLEACPYFPAAQPHGKNAYDFYFQTHFEKFFKKIYEKKS